MKTRITRKLHCFFTSPQLADIVACLAVLVGAGVRASAGVEGGYHGVGGVGAGCRSTGKGEDTADSEGGGTGSRGCSSQTGALRGSVAGPVETAGALTVDVREPDDVQN